MKLDAKALSRKLSLLANQKERSQNVIAEEIGVSQSQVSKFFRGDFKRASPNLKKLAANLKIDIFEYKADAYCEISRGIEFSSDEERALTVSALRKIADILEYRD